MAARGGRGGRGRGGAGSVFTPQLLGHLNYGDIIAQSKEGTGIFYPVSDSSLAFTSDLFKSNALASLIRTLLN